MTNKTRIAQLAPTCTATQIAARLNITPRQVLRVCAELGIKPKPANVFTWDARNQRAGRQH